MIFWTAISLFSNTSWSSVRHKGHVSKYKTEQYDLLNSHQLVLQNISLFPDTNNACQTEHITFCNLLVLSTPFPSQTQKKNASKYKTRHTHLLKHCQLVPQHILFLPGTNMTLNMTVFWKTPSLLFRTISSSLSQREGICLQRFVLFRFCCDCWHVLLDPLFLLFNRSFHDLYFAREEWDDLSCIT